jgi:hypothetical protein
VKLTVIVQLVAGAKGVQLLLTKAKSPAFGPVIAVPVKFVLAVP